MRHRGVGGGRTGGWTDRQADGCSGPLTEEGLTLTPISLCRNTAFVCLLEGSFVSWFLVFFFSFSLVFFLGGGGFSLYWASISSHLTGHFSYISHQESNTEGWLVRGTGGGGALALGS